MREIEFYSYIGELEPIFDNLFCRGAKAFTLLFPGDSEPAIGSSFTEILRLVEDGADSFRIMIPGVSILSPTVDAVLNQESGVLRRFFVHNIGGPFLEFDVPLKRLHRDIMTVGPGAFSRKREYYSDSSYTELLPSAGMSDILSDVAKQIRSKFSRYVTSAKRIWYVSPSVLKDIRCGQTVLAGPLEGQERFLNLRGE